jgi:phage nucleotide-binding protein
MSEKKLQMITGANKAGNEIKRGISLLVYADPGIGKTTLAATLPVDETLIINTEAGIGALLGTGHYVYNLDQGLKQLQKLYEDIATLNHPFKNVVLDNISELQDWMVIVLTQGRGKEFTEIREHGDASQKMREYLHLFRDLTEKGINVVFNAWEFPLPIEEQEDSTITRLYPKLYKKLAPEICGIVDMVGHLELLEKTGDRFLRFEGSSRLIAKTQFKGVDKFEPANLPALFAKVRAYNYEVKDDLV